MASGIYLNEINMASEIYLNEINMVSEIYLNESVWSSSLVGHNKKQNRRVVDLRWNNYNAGAENRAWYIKRSRMRQILQFSCKP